MQFADPFRFWWALASGPGEIWECARIEENSAMNRANAMHRRRASSQIPSLRPRPIGRCAFHRAWILTVFPYVTCMPPIRCQSPVNAPSILLCLNLLSMSIHRVIGALTTRDHGRRLHGHSRANGRSLRFRREVKSLRLSGGQLPATTQRDSYEGNWQSTGRNRWSETYLAGRYQAFSIRSASALGDSGS